MWRRGRLETIPCRWAQGADTETIERQALEWIQGLPEAERGNCTRLSSPLKFGSIAKVHVVPGHRPPSKAFIGSTLWRRGRRRDGRP